MGTPPTRHATWLELFFDLVAIAGMSALAHLLEESTSATGLLTYGVAYTAFWMVWACFTMYGNVAGAATRTGPMLIGMATLAVMAAAVTGIEDDRAGAFAVAYIIGRTAATRAWRPDSVVVDLPILQAGAGVTLWIVSLAFEGTTRYILWAVGLGLDLWFLLAARRQLVLERAEARLTQLRERRERRLQARRARGDGDPGRAPSTRREIPDQIVVAEADLPHLGERLALFVLIVLGEGLIQLIGATGDAEWGFGLLVAGAGSFLLIVGLWALAVERGYAGIALLPAELLAPRLAWVSHLFATGMLVALAAALAPLIAEPGADVAGHERRVAVLAYGGYLTVCLVVLLSATRGDATARLRSGAQLAPMIVTLVLAVLLPTVTTTLVIWLFAAGVLLTLALDQRRKAPGRANASGPAPATSTP